MHRRRRNVHNKLRTKSEERCRDQKSPAFAQFFGTHPADPNSVRFRTSRVFHCSVATSAGTARKSTSWGGVRWRSIPRGAF